MSCGWEMRRRSAGRGAQAEDRPAGRGACAALVAGETVSASREPESFCGRRLEPTV
jgi:hypothetical protein